MVILRQGRSKEWAFIQKVLFEKQLAKSTELIATSSNNIRKVGLRSKCHKTSPNFILTICLHSCYNKTVTVKGFVIKIWRHFVTQYWIRGHELTYPKREWPCNWENRYSTRPALLPLHKIINVKQITYLRLIIFILNYSEFIGSIILIHLSYFSIIIIAKASLVYEKMRKSVKETLSIDK